MCHSATITVCHAMSPMSVFLYEMHQTFSEQLSPHNRLLGSENGWIRDYESTYVTVLYSAFLKFLLLLAPSIIHPPAMIDQRVTVKS